MFGLTCIKSYTFCRVKETVSNRHESASVPKKAQHHAMTELHDMQAMYVYVQYHTF